MSPDPRSPSPTPPFPPGPRRFRVAGLPLSALALLALTAALSLLWSHYKLLNQDEMFVLQTDSARTAAQLIHIQRAFPISLDPLVYHLLSHFGCTLFGPGAFALRLPSLLGYLLMQACLFLFIRRCIEDPTTADRAGLFAMAFPAITVSLFYSAEGRPYGLLLGLYALTLLSWQSATRATTNRLPALLTLALAIALTLNSHYFGVLLLIPLCAAELFRTAQRRRLDLPVATAILSGMAAIVFALPFQKPAGEFRKHYYNAGQVGLRAITQSFRSLFVDYTHLSMTTQRLAAAAFVVLALALIAACAYRLRTRTLALPAAEAVFLIVLAALPFFGFLLARFVTHSIEVRYVLGAIIAITILLALVLAPALRRDRTFAWALPVIFLALLATGLLRIVHEKRDTAALLAALTPTPELKTAILASPDQRLYLQDMGKFEVDSYYEPDLWVRQHMALVYSRDEELRWDFHDTGSLTAQHMQHFTGFPIVPYETLSQQPGGHIFLLFHTGWDWTDQAFRESHAAVTPVGPALEGDIACVQFNSSTVAPCPPPRP
jgi:hypothetical protein